MPKPKEYENDRDLSYNEQKASSRFLLGIAASAIAFAFHETNDRKISCSLIIIGLAASIWAISFLLGTLSSINRANGYVFRASQKHDKIKDSKSLASPLADAEENTFYKSYCQAEWQLYTMLAGAIVYAIGHVLHLTT